MKKLLVIAIIACVSSTSAFARHTFMGEFDGLLAEAIRADALAQAQAKAESEKVAPKEDDAATKNAKGIMEQDYYQNLINQNRSTYNAQLLMKNKDDADKYAYHAQQNALFSKINLTDPNIINYRTQELEAAARSKMMLGKSHSKAETQIGIMQDIRNVHIAKNEIDSEMRLSDTQECVTQIKTLVGVYGQTAVEAMDSALLRKCRGAVNTATQIIEEQRRVQEESSDAQLVVHGYHAEDYIQQY